MNQINIDYIVPNHVAIIMDGNGRWAKKRGKPRTYGHLEGMNRVVDIVQASSDLGVKYLSLYAFSTENWKRPVKEVNYIMDLLVVYINKELKRLHRNNVKLQFLGKVDALPQKQLQAIKESLDLTKNNTGMTLNIALNYGARDEVLRAFKELYFCIESSRRDIESLTDQDLMDALDTRGISDIDLLIRPGGEKRLSNFMLLQNAYSEIIFSDILWPDFNEEELINCFREYAKRNRRFGGINE